MDGKPDNNDFFKTLHEYDWRETQMRAGGDATGLMSARSLDYLQGIGYQCIYIAGTHFLNMPWQSDGESPARWMGAEIHDQVIRLSISL